MSNNMMGPNGKSGHFGNASNWAANAQAIGFQVVGTQTAGSVAQWPANTAGAGSFGHVAYSETINFGSNVIVEDYNWTLNGTYHERTTTGSIEPPNYINFGANGQQVTIARHPNGVRLDLFLRGFDGAAWHASMIDGSTLSGWESLGGFILGTPTATWKGDGSELDLFAIAGNHVVFEKKYISGAWQGWIQLNGGSGTSAREEVTASRFADGIGIDLFLRGMDGAGWHASMSDGSTLGPWSSLGPTAILGAPAASWTSDGSELDVFAIGTNHIVYQDVYRNRIWSGWFQLNGGSGTAVTEQVGVTRGVDGIRLDIAIRGMDGAGWHASMPDGFTLSSWDSMGGGILGAPSISWSGSGTELDAFAIARVDYTVYESRYISGSWGPWQKLTGGSG